ncbi:hypothetical protein V8J88_12915 [Massilia sp. W12]|uniref:hypothetical protein n=1 Tax=Massilia sp. W12 TaxID=3126507 RepID=UPI0030D3872C
MDSQTRKPPSLSPFWQLPSMSLAAIGNLPLAWRFYQIRAIINAKPLMHRLAMSNVIANMNQVNHAMVYMIASDQHGVRFYLGVVGTADEVDELALSGQLLKSAFEGNFLGAELHDAPAQDISSVLGQRTRAGLLTGVPSLNSGDANSGDEESQGIERLVNSLAGECWQFIVLAQPTHLTTTSKILKQILAFSTDLSAKQKRSVQTAENTGWQKSNNHGSSTSKTKGTNTSNTNSENNNSQSRGETKGTSDAVTHGSNKSETNTESGGSSTSTSHDMIDKGYEEMQKHLSEVQIPRFRLGQSKGMFRSAIYVSADSKGLYQRLAHSVLSIFQGNKAGMMPLQLHSLDFNTGGDIGALFTLYDSKLQKTERQAELIHSLAASPTSHFFQGATWLTSEELALLMGLPGMELPGLPIRKSVDFALNPGTTAQTAPSNGDENIELGNVIQHGKTLAFKSVKLACTELRSHLFVCGVTGSGKTTTCMKILQASKQPFLVLEPAKTEYRALLANDTDIRIFPLGHPKLASFYLNPFELVSPRENLSSHIAILTNTLAAVFPMEAAMPYLVEEAIINAYKRKGWHIHQSRNYLHDEPFARGSNAWPTFSDLLGELDGVVRAKKMGTEFTEKYLGSLLARLSNLTLGIKGKLLNNAHSIRAC